jgi:hypothetical protein
MWVRRSRHHEVEAGVTQSDLVARLEFPGWVPDRNGLAVHDHGVPGHEAFDVPRTIDERHPGVQLVYRRVVYRDVVRGFAFGPSEGDDRIPSGGSHEADLLPNDVRIQRPQAAGKKL